MINPNGEGSDNPSGSSMNPGEQQISGGVAGGNQGSQGMQGTQANRFQEVTGKVSTVASDAWRQTRETAGTARERTEFFLRENPVPTLIGALAVGLAIGLAIRYSSESRRDTEVKSPLGDVNLGMLSLPFLWPFFKQVQRRYEDSAHVVKDGVRDGVDRIRDIDVDRYVKPLRKKWRTWTN
jgi:ElaB/YqjD/DUF883 family membrane-anchored ribosome-binding protein